MTMVLPSAQFLLSFGLSLFVLALLVVSIGTLVMATYAWWDPSVRERTAYPELSGAEGLSFSIIVPCRQEVEEVMRATLDALLAQSHSDVEVIFSVGHDDPETVAIALRLNIDNSFRSTGADAVQGAVQLVNYRDSWFALRNCLEYFIWFSSRLHLQQRIGFIPLGGNTVFVRRTVLEELGGWDEDCLAEDCELGVRLSALGHPITVAYSPQLATREETPDSIRSLVKQRTRWGLGFFQVYNKGLWRSLPTRRERMMARWTLLQPHLVALTGLAVPFCLVLAIWGSMPLPVTMFAFLPLVVIATTVALEVGMLAEFGRDHHFTIRARDYALLVVGTLPYQILLAFASVRAYFKWRTGDLRWEKTAHSGHHLTYLEAV